MGQLIFDYDDDDGYPTVDSQSKTDHFLMRLLGKSPNSLGTCLQWMDSS